MTSKSTQERIHDALTQWLMHTPRLKCEWSEEGKEEVNGRYYAIVATVRDENPYRLLTIHIGLDDIHWRWFASGGQRGPFRRISFSKDRDNIQPEEHVEHILDAIKA